jgi:hypothetical protein
MKKIDELVMEAALKDENVYVVIENYYKDHDDVKSGFCDTFEMFYRETEFDIGQIIREHFGPKEEK